jgi:hypothetical protein
VPIDPAPVLPNVVAPVEALPIVTPPEVVPGAIKIFPVVFAAMLMPPPAVVVVRFSALEVLPALVSKSVPAVVSVELIVVAPAADFEDVNTLEPAPRTVTAPVDAELPIAMAPVLPWLMLMPPAAVVAVILTALAVLPAPVRSNVPAVVSVALIVVAPAADLEDVNTFDPAPCTVTAPVEAELPIAIAPVLPWLIVIPPAAVVAVTFTALAVFPALVSSNVPAVVSVVLTVTAPAADFEDVSVVEPAPCKSIAPVDVALPIVTAPLVVPGVSVIEPEVEPAVTPMLPVAPLTSNEMPPVPDLIAVVDAPPVLPSVSVEPAALVMSRFAIPVALFKFVSEVMSLFAPLAAPPAPDNVRLVHAPFSKPSNLFVPELYLIMPFTPTVGRFAVISRGRMIELKATPTPVKSAIVPAVGFVVPTPTPPVPFGDNVIPPFTPLTDKLTAEAPVPALVTIACPAAPDPPRKVETAPAPELPNRDAPVEALPIVIVPLVVPPPAVKFPVTFGVIVTPPPAPVAVILTAVAVVPVEVNVVAVVEAPPTVTVGELISTDEDAPELPNVSAEPEALESVIAPVAVALFKVANDVMSEFAPLAA